MKCVHTARMSRNSKFVDLLKSYQNFEVSELKFHLKKIKIDSEKNN